MASDGAFAGARVAGVQALVETSAFRAAAETFESGHERWVQDLIALTEIPAPPFGEAARAAAFADMMRTRGLEDVEIDAEGNALGMLPGVEPGPVIVLAAHLDTVFPEGTDVEVRREGDRLFAPGIGDNSAGLATLLALAEAIRAGGIRPRTGLLFVGTVGEEGPGDLRGVRYLFERGRYRDRIKAFIAVDGNGVDEIVTAAVGSKRYRATYRGPGGHSYGAFGIVNPVAALGRTIVDLYAVETPDAPKTTYSASVIGGGTAVNAIPEEAWLDVDMRSESAELLAKLERRFLEIARGAVDHENATRSTRDGALTLDLKPVGNRPAGKTPADASVVVNSLEAFRLHGIDIKPVAGSTDANVPMSLGVPSVTLPGNAAGGRIHSPDEWLDSAPAENIRLKRMLLAAILATAEAN